MHKRFALITALAMSLTGLIGCSQSAPPPEAPAPPEAPTTMEEPAPPPETPPTKAEALYKDGTYTAEETDFDPENGWKGSIEITVKDGKIVTVIWNGTHKDGGDDKKTASINGKYPMVEQGGAKMPWHEQAALMEKWLVDNQDPALLAINETGHTDAVTGATMKIKGFIDLATKALVQAM